MTKHAVMLRAVVQVSKALADENRVRLLLALRRGERCACQLTELLGLAPSTVSKHLALLGQAGLVRSRREGRWMYFRLPAPDAPVAVREAMRWVLQSAAADPRGREDRRRMREILQEDPSELCKRQCRR